MLKALPMQDFFNGTYYSIIELPKQCLNVTLRLLYVSYAAYFDTPPCPLSNVLQHVEWCPTKALGTSFLSSKHFCRTYDSSISMVWLLIICLFLHCHTLLILSATCCEAMFFSDGN